MNKTNQVVIEAAVKDLKHIKILLSAIRREESSEMQNARGWAKREQLTQNDINLSNSVDNLYKTIGMLMMVK